MGSGRCTSDDSLHWSRRFLRFGVVDDTDLKEEKTFSASNRRNSRRAQGRKQVSHLNCGGTAVMCDIGVEEMIPDEVEVHISQGDL